MRSSPALTSLLLAASAHALPSTSGFRYLGRVNPATRELTWPSTGIAFDFTGTSASVPINVTGTNAIDLVVDGQTTTIDNVNGTSTNTPQVANGKHTVEIRKKSEALYGSIFVGKPTGKTSAPTAPKRRIELIGDSITVGYGADGTYPCVNSAAVEDGPRTYGALTAKNLSADYSIVAWSGKGIVRNYVTATVDTSPTMPELWTRYGANDADNSYDYSYQPQAVVINLGTNDFSYLLTAANGTSYAGRPVANATELTNALYTFAAKVQKAYHNPYFFITSSPLLSDGYPPTDPTQFTTQSNVAKAVVAKLGKKAYFVDFPTQDTNVVGIGCDYHPSLLEHEVMAGILTSSIKNATGW